MNLLDLTPHRASDWEERSGQVVLIRPRPRARGLKAPFEWLAYLIAPKRLRLDDFGSFCWHRVDGRRTPWEIAGLLRKEFGEHAEPAEERVGQFLKLLKREELVSFPEIDGGSGARPARGGHPENAGL